MTDVSDSDIAIVGLALRVPGALTPEQFWQNLSQGVESLRHYSDEELTARGVSPADLADPAYVKAGMPLDGMEEFDPEFFGFSPKEAAILDPQHRQFYEVAWEALERAGHPPAKFDGNVGVFGGSGMAAYFAQNVMTNPELVDSVGMFLLRHTGNDKDFLATRVAYAFDLKGPAINVQTACSTSLVAVHLAVQSLLAGECDMALAGGSTVELPHRLGYHYKEGEILSPDGHCRAFDHRSKGTVFGSGCGIVVLRRLADALADGDHIHAVIKATAVNNDGAGKVGYLAPSVGGQAAAIAEALALAGVGAETLGYVECHGTGTPVGDPIEIAAMTQAFRESTDEAGYCRVGSVKSNIGHLDTAAGVVGLIKAALALEHGQIPPSLNFEAPNPAIAFDGSPFSVAAALEPWPARPGVPRRAGVNSLGVGGTNAFAILEEPPARPAPAEDTAPQLLVLSARNRRALDESATRLAEWLKNAPPVQLADVAWSLLEGRHGFEQRRVLAAASREEAIALLENPDARRVFTHGEQVDRPSVVFMYPGGGAQYFRMGRGLYEAEPVFREHMYRGLALLKSRFGVNLDAVFLAEDARREAVVAELNKPSVQLPLIFLVEYALTRLWEHYGVQPAALIGHSLGENTAACVAGVFSFEDALGLVLLRGQLMDEVPEGGMLAVPMPAEELTPWLCGKLDLAAANSPQLSVASGPADLLDDLTARLAEEGIEAQRVRINIAAHSRLLDGILERFRAYLKSIRLQEPNLPLISNRTGKWLEPHRARDPEYWVEHLRNTVLFGEGVNTLLDTDKRIFIEVGPGVTLGSLVRQNPAAPAQRVFGSLRHPEDPASDEVFFRTVTGRLWAVGVDIDHSRLWTCPRVRAPLPTYAFQHNEYWIPPGAGAASADAREAVRPQRLAALTDWFRVPRWVQQGIVDEDPQPRTWLIFHGNDPVADALIQHVREGKHTVVTVGAGDTFSRAGEYAFTIAPEAAGVGYQELVEALREDNLLPERILHTWLLTGDRSFRPGSTFFHRNQEYGFYSLLHLAQALGRAGLDDHDIHFVVAANGVIRIGDESAPCPDKATALGPCAVIPREFPRFTCRFVDVELPAAETARARRKAAYPCPKPVLDALGAEVEAAAGSEVVAWRDGVRWRRHLGPWRQPPAREGSPRRLRRNGVYLITGGLGGIAGVLADWLAREFDARLVLVGRTPLPNRDDWDDWLARHRAEDSISRGILRVRELESLGATVLPMTADVTVAERMREVVREAVEQAGPINGVFHTAGVIRDNLIQLKSQRDIEEVFSAKVYGTMVLDEMFRDRQLDFMVLFSSTSLYVAPEGQVDYVGANAFLNAFADAHLARRPYPVTAINWGIWKDVGMMGKTPEASVGAVAATADPDLSHATPMPARHPLFQEHYAIREGVTEVHFFNGTLDASSHWVVNEHRLSNGAALLPGTGYLELIHAGLQEAGIDGPWQLTGLSFLHPLFVADNNARAFRVRLRGHERYWEVEIVAARRNGDRPDWETCATARIARDAPITPARIDLAAIQARCDQSHEAAGGSSALRTRQEDHIRFGPRWRVLKRLDLGTEEALARLQLPGPLSNDLDDYVLHPALLDIATGCAMDLVPGYTKQDTVQKLWAPISYRAVRFHARLQAEIASWIRRCDSRVADGFVAFDVTITDVQGQPLVEVEQLTLRRIDGALEMPRSTQPGETAPRGDTEPAEKPPKQAASPGEIALQHNVSQGIDVEQGIRALSRLLDAETMPASLVVSSMDIGALLRQAEAIGQAARSSSDARFTRPELDNEFEAPRDELEENLAELWGKLLGVEGVGIRDSFFDLGGHSLIAVRLFNEISDRYEVDLPMSVLMQSPTIADLAELIRDEAPDLAEAGPNEQNEGPTRTGKRLPEFRHIVPMHIGPIAADTPLFMVSGMFGNVLNLSHMAHLLGEERPFYALQARGLYGDAMPHETFEEMATDYIAEIRKVQPHGPYLIGGFSGGGIAAYEIARQLLAKGEQVSQVILLDTPLPEIATFSFGDKVSMFMQGLHAEGLPFIAKKIRIRIEWEKQKRAKKRSSGETEQRDALHFQSQRIGDAFVRAITRYEMPTVPVDVALFRPRLDVRFRLKGGRLVDGDRNYVAEDNGWTPYVKSLRVFEVPGDHDGMVLEPNVRVLVAALRRSIDDAEARIQVQAGNDQAPTIAASR